MKELREVMWGEQTREEIPLWAEKGAVVIVPIGSIEQHGLALPINTDNYTVEYVAQRAARLLDDVPVLVTPLIPFGISPHHMAFSGTITLTVETTVRLLREVCSCITAHGFERILILSGHGGNRDTVKAAALEMTHTMHRQIEADCWFYFASDLIKAVREGPVDTIGHAGEMEGSCIMALSPESIRRDRMVVVEGISDSPALGTPEKGWKVLDGGAEAVAAFVRKLAARPGRQVVGIQTVNKK